MLTRSRFALDRRFATPVALALTAACATARPSTSALDAAHFAPSDATRSRGTACHLGIPFDAERGCVFQGSGVAVTLRHHDAMSEAFRLVGAAYALDGVLLLDTNDPELLRRRNFPVLTSPFRPGVHELAVLLRYRGHGSGVFSYLAGYRFSVKAALRFEVPASGSPELVVVGDEAGGRTVPLEKRPKIRLTQATPSR